jgi:hypothetical protein
MVVALGCSLFALEAQAQSSYVYPTTYVLPTSGGVPGSVATGQVLSQPLALGTVVGQPVVAGGVVGQPIGGAIAGGPQPCGGVVGQPCNSSGVADGLGTAVGTSTLAPAQGQVLPYSYWVSSPARIYAPYGPNDQFPFHGSPYGSPNDRWSWYTMGGGSARYLARYYYPILQ